MRVALQCLAGAALSGLILALALPLGEQFYLAWFAFVPVLMAVRGKGFLPALVTGLAAVFCAAWLVSTGVFIRYRDPSDTAAWACTCLGIFGMAVSIAIGAWGDRSAQKLAPWWFAALATLLEAFLLVQIPAHLALTQYRQPLVLMVAAVGGVWLASFLLWWCNFQLARLPVKRLCAAVPAIVVVSLGASRIHFSPGAPFATFAVVQTESTDSASLTSFEQEASKANPVFVVWPEFSGMGLAANGNTDELRALSASKDCPPFVTTFRDNATPLPHNVAALFSNGTESARYAKRRLFGAETQMHAPGVLPAAARYADGAVGLNICFDSCFPEIIRDTARLPNVTVIALPAIDPPAVNYVVAGLHAAYTPFRCAEEGVAFVRADGIAYSQIVDPFGNIVAEARPRTRVLSGRSSILTHWTPYKQFGDWFLFVTAGLIVWGLAAPRLRRAEKSRSDG